MRVHGGAPQGGGRPEPGHQAAVQVRPSARSGVRAPAARRMRQAAGAAGHAPAAVEARRRPGSCGVAAHAEKGRRVVGLLGFRPSLIILYGMMLVSGHQMKSDGREHASIKVSLEGPFQATNGLPALLSCWAVRAIRAVRAEGLPRAELGVRTELSYMFWTMCQHWPEHV